MRMMRMGLQQIISLAEDIKNTILIFEPKYTPMHLSEFCSKKKYCKLLWLDQKNQELCSFKKYVHKQIRLSAKVLYKHQSHVEPKMVKIPEINLACR